MLQQKMQQLLTDYVAAYTAQQKVPQAEYVQQWQAPIYQGKGSAESDRIAWQPVRQSSPLNFADLEQALGLVFHADIKRWFQHWYAADLQCTFQQHPLSLLQVQCAEDGERLLANIAGHVLMKRRLKQSETVFIGLSDEHDDLLISVDNQTAEVGLEWIGKPQHEILAQNLVEFIDKLEVNHQIISEIR
ncbi:SecY-interacting protein [Idiomarina tyrosinivorans]|uniref:SecY-interacting protein n=1 Tax=Idiomarina tyrosinivorans TaxID=1445662 RepID=A0A432ZRL7_9GAMM|nr:SecY-interacting protein [Idiomarina tyrosinivorans]RUO80550.1 SecY-interacting protein [Idiomarina tyrosinivorans]